MRAATAQILLIYLLFLGVLYLVAYLAPPLFTRGTNRLAHDLLTYLRYVQGPLSQIGIKLPSGGGHGFDLTNLFASESRPVAEVAGQAVGLVVTVEQILAAASTASSRSRFGVTGRVSRL